MTLDKSSLVLIVVVFALVAVGPMSVASHLGSSEGDVPGGGETVADYSWYDGQSSPYVISSTEDLKGLANIVNGRDGRVAYDFYGKTVELTSDLYMNGKTFEVDASGMAVRDDKGYVRLSDKGELWEPIGVSSTNPFRGIFDGNNHMIYDIVVSGYQVAGLFGYVLSGAILDVSVVGNSAMFADYRNSEVVDKSGAYVIPAGGIAGAVESTLITTSAYPVMISGCYNEARVESAVGVTLGKVFDPLAGGIVGYIFQDNSGMEITVQDCYNVGQVAALDLKTYDSCDSGGIVGQLYSRAVSSFYGDAKIINCGNEGSVSSMGISRGQGDIYTSKSSGGIVGNLKCTVERSVVSVINCYNSGNIRSVESTINSYADVGGIIGSVGAHNLQSINYYLSNGTLNIWNCFNDGNLSAESYSGVNNIGGIIGFMTAGEVNSKGRGMWTNCYWESGTAQDAIGDDERKDKTRFMNSAHFDGGILSVSVDVSGVMCSDLLSALNSYAGDIRKWATSFEGIHGGISFDHPMLVCKVTFVGDDGSVVQASPMGRTIVIPEDAEEMSLGWTLKGYPITMGEFILMSDIELRGAEKEICTVTFNPMGGTVHPDTKSVAFGYKYGPLPDAQRNGYEFIGWFTGTSSGSQVMSDTRVPTSADHTLYARWSADILTVTPQNLLAYTGGSSTTGDQFPRVYYTFSDNLGNTITPAAAADLPWRVNGVLFSSMTPEEKAKLDPYGDGLPFIEAFYYVDKGHESPQAAVNDHIPGEYTIKVSNRNQITLDGYTLSFSEGVLTVRGANPISDTLTRIVPTQDNMGIFTVDAPTALIQSGALFRNIGGIGIPRDEVYLMVDSHFSESDYEYMLDTVADIPQTEGMQYVYTYMALVNHFNGNEVVFTDSNITIFVPYSSFAGSSVDETSEIVVVHFAGYTREAGSDIRDSTTETLYGDAITMTEHGVYFTLDSMSPIMIAFTSVSDHPDCSWLVWLVAICLIALFILFFLMYVHRKDDENMD